LIHSFRPGCMDLQSAGLLPQIHRRRINSSPHRGLVLRSMCPVAGVILADLLRDACPMRAV
jgi:hypothetical protein